MFLFGRDQHAALGRPDQWFCVDRPAGNDRLRRRSVSATILETDRRNTKGLSGRLKLAGRHDRHHRCDRRAHLTPAPLAFGLRRPILEGPVGPARLVLRPLGAAFVMIGASNAVNLTDGLDGLAIVPVMIAAACFALDSYLVATPSLL